MAGKNVSDTTNVDNWSFQENYVERLMDNAAFTAAHPNNTLVLAGPSRISFNDSVNGANFADKMLPIGMVQNMSVGQQRPLQPMQALGSARTFFTAGKSQVQFQIGRLMVNGRNLLRAMYTQAVASGLDVSKFGEMPVRKDNDEQFFLNLDSELFYIPIGLAILFRSVAGDPVGAFYMELCMLNSYQIGVQAGQSAILESVSGMADRIKPIFPGSFTGMKDGAMPSSNTMSDLMLGQAEEVIGIANR